MFPTLLGARADPNQIVTEAYLGSIVRADQMHTVYQSTCDFRGTLTGGVGSCTLPNPVPAGKRLVIESVSGAYYGDDGATLGAAYLSKSGLPRYFFPWVQCGARTTNLNDRR